MDPSNNLFPHEDEEFANEVVACNQVDDLTNPILSSTVSKIPPKTLSLQNTNFNMTNIEKKKCTEIRPSTPLPRSILQDYIPFSQCHLWPLMMSFYAKAGIDSWSTGIVPHFITSNAFISNQYARVLKAFLDDCGSQQILNVEERLYIVELGAGCGKFSYLVLQALEEMEKLLAFPLNMITYVMTDFTEENVNFWKCHPKLQGYIERGLLDFAIFDAGSDDSITLLHSKVFI